MRAVPLEAAALPSIVLIVDQNESTLASHAAEFERAGVWVAACPSPIEAINLAHELRPDLVVTETFDDVEIDFVATLKSGESGESLPVIVLAEPREDTVLAAQFADVCLYKPVPAALLLDCSKRLIARSRGLGKRSERSRRAPDLVLKSGLVLSRSPLSAMRACPTCGSALDWLERRRLFGVEYDYYRWCQAGCGLYCYERRAETWIKLV